MENVSTPSLKEIGWCGIDWINVGLDRDKWQALVNMVIKIFFYSCTVHLDIIKVLLPTDAQENCFKRSIKIYIKTSPICFGVITIMECTM